MISSGASSPEVKPRQDRRALGILSIGELGPKLLSLEKLRICYERFIALE